MPDAPRPRVVSYNIKGWGGDTAALTAAVRDLAPDVLILQETLRWSDPRTWWVDLAGRFGMARAFGGLSACGNAVLISTAVTARGWGVVRYPLVYRHSPRAAVLVRCAIEGAEFVATGSHLSTDRATRLRQAHILKKALNSADAPVLVGVDVNETSAGPAWRVIADGLRDAAEETGQGDVPTYPTRGPVRRIDAIFVDPSWSVRDYRVVDTSQTRVASDHFPVLSEVTPLAS